MVDYYLIAKGAANVPALYQDNGEYGYQSGWSVSALVAAGVSATALLHPGERHVAPAILVGRLWLVLRRRHRRLGLLCAACRGAESGRKGRLISAGQSAPALTFRSSFSRKWRGSDVADLSGRGQIVRSSSCEWWRRA
jgi:Permease for cytosine/purines, uracil, thiamine, allantoin